MAGAMNAGCRVANRCTIGLRPLFAGRQRCCPRSSKIESCRATHPIPLLRPLSPYPIPIRIRRPIRAAPVRAFLRPVAPTREFRGPINPRAGGQPEPGRHALTGLRFARLLAVLGWAWALPAWGQNPPSRLYYEQDGRGPAVVFIEDWAHDTSSWFRLLPALRPDHQLVRYDLQGQGRSEAPPDGDYTLDAHVEDLLRLMDGLEIERAHVVAAGLGARVAATAASRWPERVLSLTLINPHTAWTAAERDQWSRFLSAFNRVGRPSLGEYAALLVDRWYGAVTTRQQPWLVAFYDLMLRRQDTEALMASLGSWLETDLRLDASIRKDVPLLIVRGGRAPAPGDARLASAFPLRGHIWLEASGRVPQLDDPVPLGVAIRNHIQRAQAEKRTSTTTY